MFDGIIRWSPGQATLLRRLILFVSFLLSGGNPLFPRIPIAAIMLVLIFLLQGFRMGLRREMFGIGIVILAMGIIAIIGSQQLITDAFIIRMTNFVLGALLLGVYLELPRKRFVDDVYPILKIMTVQAMLTVVLGTFFPGFFATATYIDLDYKTIGWIFTYHNATGAYDAVVRANGIFFEPGVFQLYLNLFLFMATFVRHDKVGILMGLIGVLCTQSTIGVVIAMIMMIIYYMKYLKELSFPTKLLITALAPFALIPMLFVVLSNVNNKLSGELQGSSWARQYDLNTGLAVAANYPLFGIGFEYERYYKEAQQFGYKETQLDSNSIATRANSNGLLNTLFSVGVPLALIFFYGLFNQMFFQQRLLVAILMFMSLTTQHLIFLPFLLMFVYSGLLLRPISVSNAHWQALRSGRLESV
ncbi:hypothetical protein GV829_10230 [Sphingomonas lacunae]|uniref:O-antigen ligase-related domain-containing protein n=1 Tax=Sphingomonas lacunae TaxID=2698828 RepID=A0A6M4AUK4_9SPHN|nr:O-antigen ligase family protein [Sphingomonas lacunae]QJQ32773.1 hypothetical protein GV829_10230 [Sphingomonas lacunae]